MRNVHTSCRPHRAAGHLGGRLKREPDSRRAPGETDVVDLSLRLLRALLAVVDEGSITRAAASLGVTQQAVSGQIRQLEAIAGASLLVRTPRGVELTAAGEVVAKRGAPARYGPEARTPEECLQLVAGRKGVWIAPASAATYFSRPRLAWLPVTDAPPFRLAVAWMRNNRPALLDGFVERCRELADAEL